MAGAWEAVRLPSGERHVLPIGDLRPHDETAGCWCRPIDDEGVIVHNSLDMREQFENGRKPS